VEVIAQRASTLADIVRKHSAKVLRTRPLEGKWTPNDYRRTRIEIPSCSELLDISRLSSRQTKNVLLECLLGKMAANKPKEKRIELLQGTLDMLILQTLRWGSQHGHGVGQAIRQSSADLLKIERGSLYPALHRLEDRGLISAEWKSSDLNRRAKYYRLTAAGRKQLVAEHSKWEILVGAITRVMRPAEGD
jgi:PadR family transcriptional regulator, regulatory protein PadR